MRLENFKNARVVRSTWLQTDGRRLDCNPYMSGALEAKDALENLDAPKEPLHTLTTGHAGGIYNGPQFARHWVSDPQYGVPFLGSSDMLQADLSALPLLKKAYAHTRHLAHMEVREGMTLISCSGTIGRMVYVRPDMSGMWSSQHIMKVNPDQDKIPSGYLYAFLSSRYGIPLVIAGTYGAIIQHIEPEHIANLPVPRLGSALEKRAHKLVDEASSLLAFYQTSIDAATNCLFKLAAVPNPAPSEWWQDKSDLNFSIQASNAEPLRAWNHSLRVQRLKQVIEAGNHDHLVDLIDLEWVKWRVMFKRIDVPPEHGIEVMTQRPLFQLFPSGRWVSRKYLLNLSPKYVVPDRTILIAKQGTLGEDELYCKCEFITGEQPLSRAYSDHCMRLVVKDGAIEPGYLFAFLRSNTGFRMLRSLSEGSKQQDLHWRTVPTIPVPRVAKEDESKIAEMIYEAYAARNQAVDLFLTATQLVEKAIAGED